MWIIMDHHDDQCWQRILKQSFLDNWHQKTTSLMSRRRNQSCSPAHPWSVLGAKEKEPVIAHRTHHSLANEKCNRITPSSNFTCRLNGPKIHPGAGLAAPGDQALYFAMHKTIPERQAMACKDTYVIHMIKYNQEISGVSTGQSFCYTWLTSTQLSHPIALYNEFLCTPPSCCFCVRHPPDLLSNKATNHC